MSTSPQYRVHNDTQAYSLYLDVWGDGEPAVTAHICVCKALRYKFVFMEVFDETRQFYRYNYTNKDELIRLLELLPTYYQGSPEAPHTIAKLTKLFKDNLVPMEKKESNMEDIEHANPQ